MGQLEARGVLGKEGGGSEGRRGSGGVVGAVLGQVWGGDGDWLGVVVEEATTMGGASSRRRKRGDDAGYWERVCWRVHWVSPVEDLFADGLDPLICLCVRIGHEPMAHSGAEHLKTLLPLTHPMHLHYVVDIDEGFGRLQSCGSLLIPEDLQETGLIRGVLLKDIPPLAILWEDRECCGSTGSRSHQTMRGTVHTHYQV